MPVDRGGLNYKIVVEDSFSKGLDSFVLALQKAKAEMAAVSQAAAALKGVASATQSVANATKTNTAAQKSQATATAQALTVQQEAAKRYAAALREQKVQRAIANIDSKNASTLAGNEASKKQQVTVAEQRLAKVLNDRAKAAAAAAAVQRKSIQLTDEERNKLGLLTLENQKLLAEKQKQSVLQTQIGSKAIQSANIETEALRRQAAAARLIVQQQAALRTGLDARGVAIPVAPAAPLSFLGNLRAGNLKEALNSLPLIQNLTKALAGSTEAANRASFTFRRLFGILAAFAVARAAINGFKGLVSELIRYNANIEQATLGVASLFLAVGDVRDATGQATTAAHGLALAQGEARRQVALLRKDSLETAATFENLLEAFQVGVAPGLQAGLNVDEIRKFTVQISKAAAAIGLAQNQLAEEIRSILSGTIQARTTRIAVSLGITNEDIRRAKEAGVLFAFLQTRFAAFDAAGKESLKTFNALWTNLQEGIQRTLSAGGLDFFEAVKQSVKDLFDLLVVQDPITGLLTPDPRAVEVVKTFGAALSDALKTAKQVASALTVEDLVSASKTAASAIKNAAVILSNIITGFVKGLRDVGIIMRTIFALFGNSSLFDNKNLQSAVESFARILTTLLTITALTGIIKIALGGITLLIGAAVAAADALALAFTAIRSIVASTAIILGILDLPVLAVVLAVAAVVAILVAGYVLLQKWLSSLTGIDLKFGTIVKLVGATFVTALQLSIATFTASVDEAWNAIKFLVLSGTKLLVDNTLFSVQKILELVGTVNAAAAVAAAGIAAQRASINTELDKQIQDSIVGFVEAAAKYQQASSDIKDSLAANVSGILANNETQKSFAQMIQDGLKEGFSAGPFGTLLGLLKNLIPPDILDGLTKPLKDANASATDLVGQFEAMGGIVGTTVQSLNNEATVVKQLRDDIRDANDEFAVGTASIGLEGDVLKARQEAIKAEARFRKDTLFLTNQLLSAESARLGVQDQISQNEARILQLSLKQQSQVFTSEASLRQIADLERERAAVVNTATIARLKANDLLVGGFQEQAAEAKKEADAENQSLLTLDERLKALKDSTNEQLRQSGLTQEEQAAVAQSVLARIKLSGQLRVAEDHLSEIAANKLLVDAQINLILNERLSLISKEAAFTSRRAAAESEIDQIRLRAEILAVDQVNNAQKRVTLANAEVEAIKAETAISEEQRSRQSADLDALIEQRKAYIKSLEESRVNVIAGSEEEKTLLNDIAAAQQAINDLTEARSALELQNAAAAEVELLKAAQLKRIAEDTRKELEQPFTFGLIKAFQEFQAQALDVFTKIKDIAFTALQEISSVISKSIVDAFDPSTDENFQERFRKFLLALSEQIINMLVQIALVKSLLQLGALFGEGGGVQPTPGLGFAKGGYLGRKKRHPFASARGFARGGDSTLGAGAEGRLVSGARLSGISTMFDAIRPANLDPRDRIPIWARKGEFVLVPEAVRRMGIDVAEALNNLQFDPSILRAILGMANRNASASRAGKMGFASGGSVQQSNISSVASAINQQQQPLLAHVVADEPTMQRLLNGGENAAIDFFRRNRSKIMAGERGR